MNESDRESLWAVLQRAFDELHAALRSQLDNVSKFAEHNYNDAFLFRSCAEFTAGAKVIVLSFDVQEKEGRLHVWGDISRESGHILDEVVCTSLGLADEQGVHEIAAEFAQKCLAQLSLIVAELT